MAVPEEIRNIKRPINTIVEDSGRDTKYRYSVRERGAISYTPGGNPMPSNGKVIGHIIDGVYVPKVAKTISEPESFSYGATAFVHSQSDDIYKDLLAVYPVNDATTIMAIATLLAIKPGIACNRFSTEYNRTFTNVYYPGCAISKNSVTELFKNIGMDDTKRLEFYKKRIEKVDKSHIIAIDGTLKQDNSSVNDFSAYSRKARVKGIKDISILYAFDVDTREPLCSTVYPGNNLDCSTINSFIKKNSLEKGIIVADKGFPLKNIESELKQKPDLHFLLPVKRDAKIVSEYDALSFDVAFHYGDKTLQGKKVDLGNGRFLYSFKDAYLASKEEKVYLDQAIKKGTYTTEAYKEKEERFGTIAFNSDLDLSLKDVYKIYEQRWVLELMFSQYKGDLGLNTTRVQNDYSVIGSEFINFIATVLTSRMCKKAEDCGALNDLSYGDMMEDLSSVWRSKKGEIKTPKLNDGYWERNTLPSIFELMVKLGLAIDTTEKKKRGRPRKEKACDDKPKRKPGRPKKNS